MISLSADILVATCTATFGVQASSSTTSSYSYFALGSLLRSFTARSAELRPPRPFTDTPPVSGPMNPTLTLSFAAAGIAASHNAASAVVAATPNLIIGDLLVGRSIGPDLRRDDRRVNRNGCGSPAAFGPKADEAPLVSRDGLMRAPRPSSE